MVLAKTEKSALEPSEGNNALRVTEVCFSSALFSLLQVNIGDIMTDKKTLLALSKSRCRQHLLKNYELDTYAMVRVFD